MLIKGDVKYIYIGGANTEDKATICPGYNNIRDPCIA